MMFNPSPESELPDCFYQNDQPELISPLTPTPNHSLYLSNLDDQKFLRFSIKYLYLFRKSVSSGILKYSLSRLLVHYYPLAGRLRSSASSGQQQDDQKLEVDCNGEGCVFAEGFMDFTAEDFLLLSRKPNRSWRKLLFRVEAQSFLDIPPLIIQVTNLRCGGMIICAGINHCICDGIGSSQFLQAWAHIVTKPNHDLPIEPFHTRHLLKPRTPPRVNFPHHGYVTKNDLNHPTMALNHYLQSQPLVPTSLTFTSSHILRLKRQCSPSLKCTAFETLASHTWRSWVKSLDLSPSLNVKLLFSVNVRKNLIPEMPQGYYGNGFVLGCAESFVKDLTSSASNLHHGVKLVQHAKSSLNDENVRSLIDLMEDKTVKTDLSASLVISQWSKLGLEDLDFGEGKALHMGPLTSDIYCLFLPVIGDVNAVTVLVSMPESVAGKFEYYMMEDFWDKEANGYHFQENRLI